MAIKDFHKLKLRIRRLADARRWFHSIPPKNLSMTLRPEVVEAYVYDEKEYINRDYPLLISTNPQSDFRAS